MDQQKLEKYEKFIHFMKEQGAKINENLIQFPHFFGKNNNITGVKAISDIKEDDVIVAIPDHLVFSEKKALKNQKLKKIILSNPQVFKQKCIQNNFDRQVYCDDFNSILLLLIYEYSQKEKSFYYPIFQVIDEVNLLQDWKETNLKKLNDQHLIQRTQEFQEHLLKITEQFYEILSSSEEIIKEAIPLDNKVNFKKDFQFCFKMLATRRLEVSHKLKKSFFIPYIDFFNHDNDENAQFRIFNTELENNQPIIDKKLYKKYSNKFSFSELFPQEFEYTQEYLEEIQDSDSFKDLEFRYHYVLMHRQKLSDVTLIKELEILEEKVENNSDFQIFNVLQENKSTLKQLQNEVNWTLLSEKEDKNIWDFNTSYFENEYDDEQQTIMNKQYEEEQKEQNEKKDKTQQNQNQQHKQQQNKKINLSYSQRYNIPQEKLDQISQNQLNAEEEVKAFLENNQKQKIKQENLCILEQKKQTQVKDTQKIESNVNDDYIKNFYKDMMPPDLDFE